MKKAARGLAVSLVGISIDALLLMVGWDTHLIPSGEILLNAFVVILNGVIVSVIAMAWYTAYHLWTKDWRS